MNEKLIDSLLAYTKGEVLRVLSVLLWLSLLFVSYSRFVNKIDYKVLVSPERLCDYFISGNYALLIAWLICLVAMYLMLKYILTSFIPASSLGMRIFLKYIIPDEYKVPLLNVYYKKAINASNEHVNKAIEYWGDEKIDDILKDRKKLFLITGIVIKLLLILLIVLSNFHGIEKWIILSSIILCVIFLLFVMTVITLIDGKSFIHNIIEGISE